jgi:hypothetical protein
MKFDSLRRVEHRAGADHGLKAGVADVSYGLTFTTHDRWPSLAPMLAIIFVWLGMMLLIMRRMQAKAEAEIADLDKLVRGAPSAPR